MLRAILFVATVVASGWLTICAQDKAAKKYAKSISEKDLEAHLTVLASDAFAGRETGRFGQKQAADYIADRFSKTGLTHAPGRGTYFQEFDVKQVTNRAVYFRRGEQKKENFQDFLYYAKSETTGEEYVNLVFVGSGESLDAGKLDVAGKYVAFRTEEWADYRSAVEVLREAGAEGFIIVVEDEFQFDFVMHRYSKAFRKKATDFEIDQSGDKIWLVDQKMTEWLFKDSYATLIKRAPVSSEVIVNVDLLVEPLHTENVLGFLKGSEKPDEVIVISSHFDHEGIKAGQIYNGADDNASGTAVVLALAQAFTQAAQAGNPPKRSILFITFSGEERGLLGSKYYVSHPAIPLTNTVVDLNVDMVGRVDPGHRDKGKYVYLIGSDKISSELHSLSETVNASCCKLELDYTYNADNDPNRYYYRSDHYNFAKNNVPVIFYFNGTHEDYHKPTDTAEKIDFKMMKGRAELIFYTAWELANREKRIKVD